jgi:hypothetical protein
MTWWSLGKSHHVLELDALPVELHCLRIGSRTVAWWMNDRGRWLGYVMVGEC